VNIATAPARSASPSVFPTSRAYLWLAGIYLMLAVYGSLVPFQFRWLAWDEVLQQSQQLRLAHLRIQSRTDFVANVLLFIPLAFLVMGAVCVDRPPGRAIVAGLILVPLCAALSGGIEFVQIYFPPRTPSASDIVAESLGGALGVLLWLTAGRRITGWARQVWSSRHGRDLASLILPVYLAFLVLINVLPLDLTLSPADIYRKYREGRLTLVPFASFCANHSLMLGKALWNLLWFLPIGALLASLPAFSWEDRRNWLRVWGLGLVVATLIESMQLFVVTRFVDVTDIVVESLGVLAGWSAVRCYQQLKIRSSCRNHAACDGSSSSGSVSSFSLPGGHSIFSSTVHSSLTGGAASPLFRSPITGREPSTMLSTSFCTSSCYTCRWDCCSAAGPDSQRERTPAC